MKKIIRNKLYSTETATEVGFHSEGGAQDFGHFCDTLYRKRTGEYFIYGEGGPASRYAERVEQNRWSGGERIMPLTYEQARGWAEKNLDADEYEDEFGEVAEDGSTAVVSVSMAASTIEKARRAASEKGMSLSAYIASLIG